MSDVAPRRAPRRILLGVTGGIAAYKAAELVRRLREHGAEVQVVMTGAAQRFVTPLTFQALSGRAVRTELWDEAAEAAMGHIELARWADLVLVAPASADFLARLAHGRADDLLSTLCLATAAPVWAAPAMNRQMWASPATQANVATLAARGVRLLGPASGDQACGEVGPGRMLEAEALAALVFEADTHGVLGGLRVVISAGPTREPLDPVRFISNRSSGKMGFAVAAAARDAGAEVTLVSGPVSLESPPGICRIDVETAEQMYSAVHTAIAGADIYIGAAAVADYTPARCAKDKIKKTSDCFELSLQKAPDILASVAALERRPFTVGFAAETVDVEKHAREKLARKRLDLIAANEVGAERAFDREDNALLVLWPGGRRELALKSKSELARELVMLIAERYREARRPIAKLSPVSG
ncbi:MAG TPA: bifunctional phosphopantothenoylcysteine decarboxylase/phosphopantothenate--cysteine ligase CoaBC [Steroidobacteraceae bacterium]|nr:bifunctional phosphopantothenoylcysteine decarboxylase/phosphopantothenate--cysteine ligase CoaBC [Steroidobacteraceae bacterium]